MYKNILICIEPTHTERHRTALLTALRLAADTTAELTALTIIEPIPGNFPGTEIPADLSVQAGEQAMGQLRLFVGPTSEINTVILHGHAVANALEAPTCPGRRRPAAAVLRE